MEETTPIALEIARLKELPLSGIRDKYLETFGEAAAPSSNKEGLWRRIAFHLQQQRYGGFSQEAKGILAEEMSKIKPSDRPRRRGKTNIQSGRDKRIPMAGTILIRKYKKQEIEVKVLDVGFEYQNKVFSTLSAVAKEITGSHWNGMKFFNL
ncbi:MAG: DUF2924 domain-containing protein [Candidatus Hinthialibacter antarcticus]|nr:DUF2924 domain-containing protein [Candidatus Hinthialibacter antarcticus]